MIGCATCIHLSRGPQAERGDGHAVDVAVDDDHVAEDFGGGLAAAVTAAAIAAAIAAADTIGPPDPIGAGRSHTGAHHHAGECRDDHDPEYSCIARAFVPNPWGLGSSGR